MSQFNWTSVGSDFQLKYEYEDESEQYFTTCYQPVNYFADGYGEFDNSYSSPLPANTIPIINDEDSLNGLEEFTANFQNDEFSNIDFDIFNDISFTDIRNTIMEKNNTPSSASLSQPEQEVLLAQSLALKNQQQTLSSIEDLYTENNENLMPDESKKNQKFVKNCNNHATTSSNLPIENNSHIPRVPSPVKQMNIKFPVKSEEELDENAELNEDDEPSSNFEQEDYLSGDEVRDDMTPFSSSAETSVGGQMGANEPQISGGFAKPSYSYSCLIGLSLKNSTTGELTVSEIYTFLCEHFPYFRTAPTGWKNSVRHNLSLNKCFQKIDVETPGSHGRKSCLWRLNPLKIEKMNSELRKWRERNELAIRRAMRNPDDLDAIQNGTKGMPSIVRRRTTDVQSIEETTYIIKTQHPKIMRRIPYGNGTTSYQNKYSEQPFQPLQNINYSPNNDCNRQQKSPLLNKIQLHNQNSKQQQGGFHANSNFSPTGSVREAAARRLDILLQKKSSIKTNPSTDFMPQSFFENNNDIENIPPRQFGQTIAKTELHPTSIAFNSLL